MKASSYVGRLKQRLDSFHARDKIRGILRRRGNLASKDGHPIKINVSPKTPLLDERTGKPYTSNVVNSSRYTIWNFLPCQLFFQFTKLANLYLLILAILHFIPNLSPTANYTGIIPLMVMVSISIGKEGCDDIRRYRLDKAENNNQKRCLVAELAPTNHRRHLLPSKRESHDQGNSSLRASSPSNSKLPLWESRKWKVVKVGDVIKLERDEDVPADIVLLHAEGPYGTAYIETASLDGETNLKAKQPCAPLSRTCGTLKGISEGHANIVVEAPNMDLYDLKGRVEVSSERLPLDMSRVILRGSTLRNTSSAIGMVFSTGEECRIRMNANKNIRTKSPELQKAVNRVVILVVAFVISLVVYCTTWYQFWAKDVKSHAWYLWVTHFILSYAGTANLLLLNTFIPLALCELTFSEVVRIEPKANHFLQT